MPISEVYNMDCLDYMKTIPDKFFDLCIADPPYGISMDGGKIGGGVKARQAVYAKKDWDKQPPDVVVFSEILRISKNAIIWGANHFISRIPIDSSCWIIWDKDNGANNFADCELAFTNFRSAVRKFQFKWQGMLQGNMKNKELRIHPTQKPIALYSWILDNYATGGGKIFDPFLGSGSSRIAAYMKGFDFWGCELDETYFKAQEERFRKECFGEQKLKDGRVIIQESLF